MSKILVVDDEPKSVKLLRLRLEEMGHQLHDAHCVKDGTKRLETELFDLLITDVRLPDGTGIDLLGLARSLQPTIPVIVITAYGAIRDAVEAMRLGAVEYVLKPFELEAMAVLVERVLESASIREEHSYLLNEQLEGEPEVTLVGHSAAMDRVRDLVKKVAATRSNVLLLGESGTGKELVARAIHVRSTGRAQPLVKVNCPGIPAQLFESELFGHMKGAFTGAEQSRKGKFELAGKGNILLDEISEIPFELQAKLLRVLEERRFTRIGGSAEVKVEARVIAATNRNLKAMVEEGRFREDLYYRLNVFPIELPPLRDRREDIAETALHLLCHIGSSCGLLAKGISDEAMAALTSYRWPGNTRELRNVLERGLVLGGGGTVQLEHLPVELQDATSHQNTDGPTFHAEVERFKRELLLQVLRETGWSKKQAAANLGLSQRAFSHYVTKYGLDEYRESPNGKH